MMWDVVSVKIYYAVISIQDYDQYLIIIYRQWNMGSKDHRLCPYLGWEEDHDRHAVGTTMAARVVDWVGDTNTLYGGVGVILN